MIGTSFAKHRKKGFFCKVDNKQEKISSMILNYLRKNPEAGDTLEGITKWWIGLEKIELSVDEVAYALDNLMNKDLIRTHKIRGGVTFYKVKKKDYLS